ncbi:protein NRDE2 homolog [Asparagus officinalis]|uniref:protein NRDE2 homolog n=1 Tax=Asparagus officinalis TaxID=4686 RepID=UPI00098E4A7A|nr:protein NRDE2 homolog [Asparagus officinalis]
MEPSRISPANSSSLFPLTSNPNPNTSSTSNTNPQWLSNPSYTLELSSLPSASAAVPPLYYSSDDEPFTRPDPPSYDLVGSAPSDSDSDGDRRSLKRKEKKRRKKKRRRESEKEGSEREAFRKPGVLDWAGSETKLAKGYHFDVHGDQDNLVYGSLYRMDVPRYRLHSQSDMPVINFQLFRRRPSNLSMDIDGDVDIIDSKLKTAGRYCSVNYSTLERHKGLKHVKIVNKMSSLVPGEYIPLIELHSPPENGSNLSSTKGDIEESWEDEVFRRTRELNKMSRDFPHDEKVWLAFAEFQDKLASTQLQKAARLQTLEKKISILEKAVDINPDSEELLLCLMKSYRERDSRDVLMERWKKVLMLHSDNVTLWKEFLIICQGEFSQFKVSDIRRTYAHAIQALSSACDKLCRQGWSKDPSLVQLELGLVDMFINLCRFEWQTGYQELATGLFQAEIEYSLFCPSMLLSAESKRRLFEHFWSHGGARLGEDGALGWSIWLTNEQQQKTLSGEFPHETEIGGWTGWSDPPSKKIAFAGRPEQSEEHAMDNENTDEKLDDEDVPLNDDVESLLKRLGVNVDAEPHNEIKDAKTWNRWAEEELSRDADQWMPVHNHSGNHGNFSPAYAKENQDIEDNEQLSRVILFEEVNDYLFSLHSEEARFSLVSQFIDFYGGKINRWTCTNNSSWIEKLLSLETIPNSISEDLRVVFEVVNRAQSSPINPNLELLLGSTHKLLNNNMMKFLRNAILLLLNVFPRNHILQESLLAIEDLFMNKIKSSTCAVNPSRCLAKNLLKNDRQDLLLCGVYARNEANYGNIDIARKIYDMAISSTDGLPPDLMEYVPLLYFWYAEMEMEICRSASNSDSPQRAVHILCCLGGNIKYTPFKSRPSGLQILRARQGFKEQIKVLQSAWALGDIKEYSVVLICAASLFEALVTGLASGIEVIEEAFSMTLPERRTWSLQLETLWIYYIGILQKHLKELSFTKVWESIAKGLRLYPYNPKSFTSVVEVSSLYIVPHKVRMLLDECFQRKPSLVLCLFALLFELSKNGSSHRIRGLFEKALANDQLQKSVLLWRFYLAYEADLAHNPSATRRIFFRAVHACPW